MATQQQQWTQESKREGVRQYADWSRRQVVDSIEHYPITSVLLSFGIGLGVGVVIGSALAEAMPWNRRPETLTERLGRQVMEALSASLPESLASRLPDWR